MTLAQLKVGKSATILSLNCEKHIRRRLLDMGLTPKTKVKLRRLAPFGDPIELCLRGYELTIRKSDAASIEIEEDK